MLNLGWIYVLISVSTIRSVKKSVSQIQWEKIKSKIQNHKSNDKSAKGKYIKKNRESPLKKKSNFVIPTE